MFTLVTEMVLRPLLQKWRSRGSGWMLDSFWLAAVCYADDIVMVSSSQKDLEKMVAELIEAFEATCLDVGTDKSHWTSFPPRPDAKINFRGDKVVWENFDICWNSAVFMRQ